MSTGVLLMAYGSPETPAQVEAYFTHIRGGRTPSPQAVQRLQRRYELVGGRTPLLAVTNDVRAALERRLNGDGGAGYRVYVGMKHWHPFINEVLPAMASDGVDDIVAVALAPHYSRMSIGGYRRALDEGLDAIALAPAVRFVDHWHTHPRFISLMAQHIAESLAQWPTDVTRDDVITVFSAHSLPQRIRDWNDPYERQFFESCELVAREAGIDHWRVAWQSAGDTGEPWLGPDIGDVIEALHRESVTDVLSVPIGFVCDHLEVLYDIDHETRRRAEDLGMTLRRTPMPNSEPALVDLLAALVIEARA